MKKYLRLIDDTETVFDVPLEVVAEMRADAIARQEVEDKDADYGQIYEGEYENSMEEDDVIEEWSRENITLSVVKIYAIRMDRLKDKSLYKDNFKDNIKVVFH